MKLTQESRTRKEQHWQEHINNWRESGLSQKEYGRRHSLALATFGYWKRKLQCNPISSEKKFYPLMPAPVQMKQQKPSDPENGNPLLHLGRFRLEIQTGFDSVHLGDVITALEGFLDE